MLKRVCFDILPRIKRKRRLVLTSNLQSKQLQNSTENVTLCKNLYYFLIFILDWTRFSNASSSVLMLSNCKVKSGIFFLFFYYLQPIQDKEIVAEDEQTFLAKQQVGFLKVNMWFWKILMLYTSDLTFTCDRPVFRRFRDFSVTSFPLYLK